MDKDFSFNKLLSACFILYGPLFHFSIDKLRSLSLVDLKSIFHCKAKLFHPDRAKISGKSEEYLLNRFKELNNAYSLLYEYIKTYSNKNITHFCKVNNFKRNENNYSDINNTGFFYSYKNERPGSSNNHETDINDFFIPVKHRKEY